MKALLSKTPGGPASLAIDDVAPPRPGKGQLLIDVHAVGVNYPDVLIIQDQYQVKPPRPFSPGGELAGRIAALGEGVEGLAVGERVIASLGWGAMAEQVAIDAWRCARSRWTAATSSSGSRPASRASR